MAFLIIHDQDGSERRVDLNKPTISFGRSDDVDVQVDIHWVSSEHARIVKVDDGFEIEDLGSSNGTFVNYERVEKRTLKNDDLVFLGRTKMVFNEKGSSMEESSVELNILDSRSGIITRAPQPFSLKTPKPARAPTSEEMEVLAQMAPSTPIPEVEEAEALAQAMRHADKNAQLKDEIRELSAKLTTAELELAREKRDAQEKLQVLEEELSTWKSKYFALVSEQGSTPPAELADPADVIDRPDGDDSRPPEEGEPALREEA